MTTTVNSLLLEKTKVVGQNSVGYTVCKALYPNLAFNATDSVTSVTVNTAGTGYTTIPVISFTGGGGTGAAATATVKALTATVVTPQSGSGSYVPSDTITLAETTAGTQPILTVTHTQVVSATVTAGGTSGTPGTQTVTGTTGTGTKFQASVTVSGGGAISAVNSITVAGDYTVNPSSLTAEPVTGASLSGATLNLKMGVLTATVSTAGSVSALHANPVPQGASSGAGTGATFNLTYGVNTIVVSNGGNDYATAPTVVFTGGGGSGAAATANLTGVNSPAVLGLQFSTPLPTSTYSISGVASEACLVSSSNKTIYGCTITMTPLDGNTLTNGTVDVILEYTN